MKHVKDFTYLLSVISSDGKIPKNIEGRGAAATRAFGAAETENVGQERNKPRRS